MSLDSNFFHRPRNTIQLGGRPVGYRDLLQVIEAKKKGLSIDLDAKQPVQWNCYDQLALLEQRKRDRINKSSLEVRARSRVCEPNLQFVQFARNKLGGCKVPQLGHAKPYAERLPRR